MKSSFFAICLLATGAVYGQTTTGSSSYSSTSTTTTTNSNMSDPSYNTTSTTPTGTMSGTDAMGNGTTTNGTYSSGSTGTTTGTGAMNSATYNNTTTTTTATASSDYNSDPARTRDGKGDRAWGKEGKFGIYAGLNFSRFVNEPIPDNAYRTGWQAGIYGRSGGTIFGQIGLEYRNSTSNLVRSGSAIGNPVSGTGATGSETRGQIDQHFIAIPAYVGARIGALAGLRIQAGLELSSLVAVGNNNFGLGRDDLNRTILNGLLGAGINLGPVTLDAVYNLGLQNVFDNADTKRRMLAFNVGFRF